jgi:hypothetical protein
MERSWFETIQLLGLDVMTAIALTMLVLDWIIDAVAHVANVMGRRAAPGAAKAKTHVVDLTAEAWPPEAWRSSH